MRFWVSTRVGQVSASEPGCTDRQHRFPRNIDHVAAEREIDHRVIGQAELAATDEADLLMRAPPGKNAVHPSEAELEGQLNVSVYTTGETPS
jgi:hypothetical protein